MWPGATTARKTTGEKSTKQDSSRDSRGTDVEDLPETSSNLELSEDQEVEEDPLEDKIHRILGDLEEVFC